MEEAGPRRSAASPVELVLAWMMLGAHVSAQLF